MAFIANAGDACNAMTDAATKEMLCFFFQFFAKGRTKRKAIKERSRRMMMVEREKFGE
jgi:hypothetical protein